MNMNADLLFLTHNMDHYKSKFDASSMDNTLHSPDD